ncbi:5'-nucleotidase /3'-nucleotidase /exopolyphosphatase [Marinobacter daqiaonensis]|uniref:5'-nucleotidase SurE n=1 Tax=Marinobacter daqiaonensis TaxID=650891 RepID=A0A1I6ILX5_9GAMM|nr:5'/3'-nucleotidase SurE [Marinobacter daqiaonensis]SFR67629.1 5'-nucleotidase /3'-nucleotidase /exopolyphosphatase [Marinobacter daqiaonensis]
MSRAAAADPMVRRILITNDDGVAAPGLKILVDIARRLAEEVWIVAPEHDRSGAGQSISLHDPLRVYCHAERHYAVSGTPADCVLYALAEWFGETPPDLVLSGINAGGNIGDSVQYSGTVGAVLSAEHLGIPAIALSQAFTNRDAIDWSPVTQLGETAIRALWPTAGSGKCCWNVNFPACRAEEVGDMEYALQSTGSIARPRLLPGQDSRGLSYWWLGFDRNSDHPVPDNSDVAVLRRRGVAASPLRGDHGLPGGQTSIALQNR